MKKGRFLWSAHRITERQKAGKARNIKGKQLKNSRNTVSKQLVEHHSSQNDNQTLSRIYKDLESFGFPGLFFHNKRIVHTGIGADLMGVIWMT
jgi:hypothetical protein